MEEQTKDYSHLRGKLIENRISQFWTEGLPPPQLQVADIDPEIGITINIAGNPKMKILCLVEPEINRKRNHRPQGSARSHESWMFDFLEMVKMIERGYIDDEWVSNVWFEGMPSSYATTAAKDAEEMTNYCPFM